MPNWKRIVVGDAFRLPSRDFNYYRDFFLFWPFLIFTILGLVNLITPDHAHTALGMKCLALGALAILLARERLILFLGALGFCAIRFLIVLLITGDWSALLALLATAIPVIWSVFVLSDYKPSYEWSNKLSVIDVVLSVSSLGFTLVVFSWIQR